MGKKNQNISSAKKGMIRDAHPSGLPEGAYTDALNNNIEDESGNGIPNNQNEHSNILCTTFKDGYKVVGHVKDELDDRTYFFLTNPDTGKSEIGYVPEINFIENEDDIEYQCGCDFKELLNEALENTKQKSTCRYTTVIDDGCNSCLNFSIDHPIRNPILKVEKANKRIFFTDGFNPPRWIDLNNLDQYKEEGVGTCSESLESTCLDCNKLLVFPKFQIPCVEPEVISGGGNLKKGTYESIVAYCDALGNELSNYYSVTTPVSIFDLNNLITDQSMLNDRVNRSIRFTVDGLDTDNFRHYKVAVIQRTNLAVKYFINGVYTTDNTSFIVDTDEDKTPTDIFKLTAIKPYYTKANGMTEFNGTLMQFDLETVEELNLQPVVNLMSAFLKWQTHQAKEDIYAKGTSSAKYRGYMRDEVYPFSVQFETDYNYVTTKFPLVGRPPTADELLDVDTNSCDYKSINKNVGNCEDVQRLKKWQYYNTAQDEGFCSVGERDCNNNFLEYTEVEKYCIEENVFESGSNTLLLPLENAFIDIESYMRDVLTEDVCNSGSYPSSDPIYTQSFETLCDIFYTDYPSTCNGNDFYVNDSVVYDKDCDGNLQVFPCINIQEKSKRNILNEIVNQKVTLVPKDCLDYRRNSKPSLCINRVLNQQGSLEVDQFLEEILNVNGDLSEGSGNNVYNQDKKFDIYKVNESTTVGCENFSNLFIFNNGNQPQTLGINLNFYYGESKDESQIANSPSDVYDSSQEAKPDNTLNDNGKNYIYSNFIHKNAIVYKGDVNNNKIIIELSESTQGDNPTQVTNDSEFTDNNFTVEEAYKHDFIRVSVYNTCDTQKPVYSEIYNLKSRPDLICLSEGTDFNINGDPEKDITGGDFFVKLDSPYTVVNYFSYDPENKPTNPLPPTPPVFSQEFLDWIGSSRDPYHFSTLLGQDLYVVVPNTGCFAINQRAVEYKEVELTFDNISINSQTIYEASCPIIVPKLDNCDPRPYKKGSFSYWESLEKYPDNCELYDSSNLKISSEDIPDSIKSDFEEFFVDTVSNTYELKEDTTNLSNTPIRHYKFPSNTVSPFITEGSNLSFKESIVYPLGVTLDKEVVNAFLDIAVKNKLITQQQRDGIKSFKLYRGDRRLDKSVKAKGLLYDMRTYDDESGNKIHYPNYPYNDLGDDYLNTSIQDGKSLKHPHNGTKNNRFTFHSPDYHFENPAFGTEVNVEAYMYGKSRGVFNEVEGHPKWVIISDQARNLATALAVIEEAIEAALTISEATKSIGDYTYTQTGGFLIGGTGASGAGTFIGQNIPGIGTATSNLGIVIAQTAINAPLKVGERNLFWQKVFRDLGSPKNFSSFYTSVGNYNFIKTNSLEDNKLRGISSIIKLKSGRFRVPESNTSNTAEINNSFREWNTFVSLGDGILSERNESPECDFINYPIDYSNYDNFNVNPANSSRTSSSLSNVCSVETPEIFKNIASPYISVKDYLPSQYGNISDVTWMPINHCGDLSVEEDCQAIFGGDIYISRMTLKRKLPMFLVDAMDQASLTPFQYTLYNNIGKPRFYINYEIEERGRDVLGSFFPRIKSDVKADCTSDENLYYQHPTKFYLYYYGIPSFLVESEINLNYRYAKREEFEQFYPQRTDYENWTQEKNMSIREQNTYFHNRVYSYGTIFGTRAGVLSNNYSKEIFDQLRQRPNGVIQSNVDASENNLGEPWLVYKPNNLFEFPTKYGKLIDLKTIESQTILGRFEDQAVIYNRFDNINDKLLPNQKELGTGTVFTRSRPIEFSKSDLGYAGTQNTALVSCQAGHFWVDAKRGQVFHLLPNASNLKEISNLGMRNWFKEHMPFKILKSRVKNLTHSDLDNNYKGLGITMAWDDRYRRVFITKLDYKVKKEYVGKLEYKENNFFYGNLKLSLKDKRYFEDTSFTIAYSPITEGWISFYSYKPNYYIEYNNYFQSGMNFATDSSEEGLWSHLLTNRSYQVFYGKLYPWRIEYPVKEQYVNKKLESIQYWLDSKRYHNDYDFAENREIGFDKLWIYNNSEITGELRLNRQKTIRDISKYPKTAPDGSYQDILITEYDKRWNVNNFYNRTKDENNNVPLWNWDANQIDKTMNTKAVSFKGKRIKERLRGDWFLVRLEQTLESRYKTILKWGISKEDIYNQ
jgi:hypothetical protein